MGFAIGVVLACIALGITLVNLPPLPHPDELLEKPPALVQDPLPTPTRDTFTAHQAKTAPAATVTPAAPRSTAPTSSQPSPAGAAKPTGAPRPVARPTTAPKPSMGPSSLPPEPPRAPQPVPSNPAPQPSLHCIVNLLGIRICLG